jgi:plastocyanin
VGSWLGQPQNLFCNADPGFGKEWKTNLPSIMKTNLIQTVLGSILLFLVGIRTTPGATVYVAVRGSAHPHYSPDEVTIRAGDTVQWDWDDPNFPAGHSVTSGSRPSGDGLFNSGSKVTGSFAFTFTNSGTYIYFCANHANHNGRVIVNPAIAAPPQLLNISTRLAVQTGENVMIGGFIITGNADKKVIVRAIGPSLQQAGVNDALADPVAELRGPNGSLITNNDNWMDTQRVDIEASGVAPQNDLESAIVATLQPGNYTVVVSGKNSTAGVGLVEVYDLSQGADARLANISTRGPVRTGGNVMIGGFILGSGNGNANVIVRALGPSLAQAGINGALADPTLELHDGNGALLNSNDNWKESQQAEIEATGIPPQNDLEPAIKAALPAGAITAIVAGKDGTTGVGLIEVYRLP